jgi:uncharacterized coiled-coil DUF342 family protein
MTDTPEPTNADVLHAVDNLRVDMLGALVDVRRTMSAELRATHQTIRQFRSEILTEVTDLHAAVNQIIDAVAELAAELRDHIDHHPGPSAA